MRFDFPARADITRFLARSVPLLMLVLTCALPGFAEAQVKIRFALDWRTDGQQAPFFMAAAKGYFKQEGLEVQFDTGTGSALAVSRTASSAYDMGYGDMSALIEFLGNNPDTPSARVQAVYIVADATPAAAMVMANSAITKPADLVGRTLGAPVFDSGRKLFPIFARANGFDPAGVKWQSMDPSLREQMLARGQVDGVTGFQPSAAITIGMLGVKEDALRIFHYKDFGVTAYGNAILANPRFIAEQPKAVAGFLRAFNRAMRETAGNYAEGVKILKQRDALLDEATEVRRLRGLFENFVLTPAVRAEGLGQANRARLDQMVKDVATVFGVKQMPDPTQVFNDSFLPPAVERRL